LGRIFSHNSRTVAKAGAFVERTIKWESTVSSNSNRASFSETLTVRMVAVLIFRAGQILMERFIQRDFLRARSKTRSL
jgi:hypothetical protein